MTVIGLALEAIAPNSITRRKVFWCIEKMLQSEKGTAVKPLFIVF